jgi:hypothetical protein
MKSERTRFRDLSEREDAERTRQARRLTDLNAKAVKRGGDDPRTNLNALQADEAKELARLRGLNEIGALDPLDSASNFERVDPLFVAVRDLFNARPALIGSGDKRVFNFGKRGRLYTCNLNNGIWVNDTNYPEVVTIALVLGSLIADGALPPRVAAIDQIPREWQKQLEQVGNDTKNSDEFLASRIFADPSDPAYGTFSESLYAAIGQAQKSFALAADVLSILDEEGDPTGSRQASGAVDCQEFARVVRCLIDQGIAKPVAQLHRRVTACLNQIQDLGSSDQPGDDGISLPDLNQVTDYQIQGDNVKLMGPLICAAMFEELKVFQVLDKLVELSQNGMLPIGQGEAGKMLYLYWKNTPNRISEGERRNIYAMTLGIPGGDGGGTPNREFNDLWLRFVSAVSSLIRQRTADQILRSNLPAAISQQQVRKAARDLAMNLSSRGYGMTYYLARDLRDQISEIIKLLGDKQIMAAYGARDMWQVIDQVATLELGGARNTSRYRTLATCGAIITAWLANKVERYNKATSRVIIDIDEVLSLDPPTSPDPTKTPTDYDLVNACELWLADTATSDQRIEELSQPREAPVMTSRPVAIPSLAREMLEQAGVGVPGFGMSAAMTRQ